MAYNNFKGKRFTEISSSVLTRQKELYRTIPAVLRLGKKSKLNGGTTGFFDYKRILSASDKNIGASYYGPNAVHVEQDISTNEVVVFLTASLFRDNMNEYLSSSLSSGSYSTISASFFNQIGVAVSNMPPSEAYVGILVNPFEIGSSSSLGTNIIAPCTSSYRFTHGGVADSSKGECILTIHNESTNALYSHFKFNDITSSLDTNGQRLLINQLTGSNLSHLTRSFDEFGFHYIQPEFVPEWHIRLTPHDRGHIYGGQALTASFSSSTDMGVLSGSALLNSTSNNITYYNGSDNAEGGYHNGNMKGFVGGDGDFGLSEANALNGTFFPVQQYIFYPSSSTVRSGSFRFSSESQGAAQATASATSTAVTLYYISGAKGPSGSSTGSLFADDTKPVSGSHIWLDATLKTPASAGFYSVPGTGTVISAFIGGNYTGHSTFNKVSGVTSSLLASQVPDGQTVELVPRWASSSAH